METARYHKLKGAFIRNTHIQIIVYKTRMLVSVSRDDLINLKEEKKRINDVVR